MIKKNERIKLSPYFLLPPKRARDKHFQEFEYFVTHNKAAIKCIDNLRKINKINIKEIVNRINRCKNIAEKNAEYTNEFWHKWHDLESFVNTKISISDVRLILNLNCKPYTWENSLGWYIISGEIKPNSIRCSIKLDEQRNIVILELSPEASIRDVKSEWETIDEFQKQLSGWEIKNKHAVDDKKRNEQLRIARDYKKYKGIKRKYIKVHDDPTPVSNKTMKKMELVEKYNLKAVNSRAAQKKEEARQRQVFYRYKKLI